jgi:predicted RNA binding protein YcfA (HicA-like mRNA interferase family)
MGARTGTGLPQVAAGAMMDLRWDAVPTEADLPRTVRELIRDLERAGFSNRGGRGSHRNFVHPKVHKPVTVSGQLGDDAKQYQERAVRLAIEESKR